MGFFSNRISREELQQGDHIYAYRRGHTFSHHGIYVGGGRVIHFTARNEPSSRSAEPPCADCGHGSNTAGGVLRTCIDCFLHGHGLLRFEYGVSRDHFKLKNKGTCSTESCYPRDESVRRATEIFNKDPYQGTGFGEYNLVDNNCENFASYCKRGTLVSEQVARVKDVGRSISNASTSSTSTTAAAADPSTTTSKTSLLLSIAASLLSSKPSS